MKMALTEKNKTITIGSKILNSLKKTGEAVKLRLAKMLLSQNALDKSLLNAVKKRDLNKIKFLIKAGADANASSIAYHQLTLKDKYDEIHRPLDYAIYKRDYELASYLAQNGAKLDSAAVATVSYEFQSLVRDFPMAVSNKWMTLLVDCGYLNYSFINPSHARRLKSVATFGNHLTGAELSDFRGKFKKLIELGFGKGEHRLLSEIAQGGDIGVLKMMMQNGFDAKKIQSNDVPLLHALYFRRNRDTNKEERQQVFQDIVTLSNVDVNVKYEGGTILHLLVLENEAKQIKFLLKNSNVDTAIKNDAGEMALDMAIKENKADCMTALLSTGPKRTKVLNQLLFNAVCHSAIDCAKVLLEMGADVNGQNGKDKLTPLMKAETVEIAELLIDYGADVSDRDTNGTSVLHHLIQKAPKEVIISILENGVSPNVTDENGKSVLMCLPAERSDVLTLLLVHPEINLNAKDENGDTALIHYVRENNLPYVRLMSLAKANLNERNNKGETALIIASQNGYTKMHEELHRFISANYLPIQTSVSIVRKQLQTITLSQRDNAVNSIGD